MVKKARRIRKAWTAADVKQLKAFIRERVPVRQIAAKMKRTDSAVRQKAFVLGVSIKTAGPMSKPKAKAKSAARSKSTSR